MNNFFDFDKLLNYFLIFLITTNIVMFLYIFGLYAVLSLVIIVLSIVLFVTFAYIKRFKNIIEAMEECINESMERVSAGIDIHTALTREMPYIDDQPAMIKMSRNLAEIKENLVLIPIRVSEKLREVKLDSEEFDDEEDSSMQLDDNSLNITSNYMEEDEDEFMKRIEERINNMNADDGEES